MHILSLQLRKLLSIHPLVLHEQTGCIAATKLIWTAIVLNGSEASGTVRHLKYRPPYYSWTVYKIF